MSTPTGSVDFYDGATLLGSATLSSGTATYATSSLASGTYSITATYAGDSNFLSVTSSAVSLTITDVTLAITTGGSSTATISAGGTATYHLTIAPSTGSALPDVTLSASGAPAGSTLTITPSTIAAGAAATDVTVTVQLAAHSAAFERWSVWEFGLLLPALGMLVVPLKANYRRMTPKRVGTGGLLLVGLLSISVISSCGGSSSPAAPPPQPTNYTINITATSGGVSHSTALTLTVR